jgi:hypothetical protein
VSARSEGLRRHLDLLLETLDEDGGGDALAGRAYLSRLHFDRLLRGATGEAPDACVGGASCAIDGQLSDHPGERPSSHRGAAVEPRSSATLA